jgi:hypothetical protein
MLKNKIKDENTFKVHFSFTNGNNCIQFDNLLHSFQI